MTNEIKKMIDEGMKGELYFELAENGYPLCCDCMNNTLTDEGIINGNNVCDECGEAFIK